MLEAGSGAVAAGLAAGFAVLAGWVCAMALAVSSTVTINMRKVHFINRNLIVSKLKGIVITP